MTIIRKVAKTGQAQAKSMVKDTAKNLKCKKLTASTKIMDQGETNPLTVRGTFPAVKERMCFHQLIYRMVGMILTLFSPCKIK